MEGSGTFGGWAMGTLAVVPVLIGPLQALLAALWYIIPAIAIATGGAVLALFRPETLRNLAKVLWRLKIQLLLILAASVVAVRVLAWLWPLLGGAPAVATAKGGADWPIFRGGLARLGAPAGCSGPTRGKVNWARQAGQEWFFASPAVVGNRVYVASALVTAFDRTNGVGRIYCFDADSGTTAWAAEPRFAEGHPTYRATFASPVIHGDYVVCGEGLHYAAEARIVCLDARTGKLRWSYKTASHVECTPVIAPVHVGGREELRVFVGAGDDGYYCLDLATGALRWHLPGKDYPDAETALTVHEGKVYAGLGNGGKALCVMDGVDGRQIARAEMPYAVFSPPAIADGKLYVGMGNGDFVESGSPPAGEVWCVDLAKLEAHRGGPFQPDWVARVGGTVLGAVAVAGDRAYFGDAAGILHAADRRTGQLVGSFNAHAALMASPAVSDSCIYIITEGGMLYGLDRRTLAPVWEYRVGSAPRCISSPAVAGGRVYVGTQENGFLCVGEGGERRQAGWPGRLGGVEAGGNPFGSPPPPLGEFHWQFPADQEGKTKEATVAAPPAIAGDQLLVPLAAGGATLRVASTRSGLACLPAQGEDKGKAPAPKWHYPTPNGVYQSPAIAADLAFCVDGRPGDAGRHLHCLAVADGKPRWKAPVDPAAAGAFIAAGDDVLIWDGPARLSRYDLAGRPTWSRDLAGRGIHAPAAAGSMVVAATSDGPAVFALDRPTGAVLWRTALESPPAASPWVRRDRLYLATARGLEARSLVDGQPLPPQAWAMEGGGVSADFVVDATRAVFVNSRGELVVLRLADGRLAGPPLGGAKPGTTPLLGGGTVLYEAADGRIMKWQLPGADAAQPASQPTSASQVTQPAAATSEPGGAAEPMQKPAEWLDASWLGEPATPMILSGPAIFQGRTGWGLVRMGEGK